MSSNVPHSTFTATGVVAPSESDIRAGLWADFQDAFGGNLNESDATPQGQLVAALGAIIGGNNDLFLQFVNQVDPAYAAGRMQDAIARIYYLSRILATSTLVTCTCTGSAGTFIPAGSLAQSIDGTIYQSLGDATIGSGGTVAVPFAALTTGPIQCPAGSLTIIYRVISGWDSITNDADGVPGRDEETRADFENRRGQSVALNSTGILPSVRAAVLDVDGVADAYVTENSTASSVTVGGVAIAARSLYVAVFGGTDADVARAIWTRKPPGCGYVGGTTVTVTDSASGYSLPYPSYSVTFQRAAALPIYMAVQLANNGLVPADAVTQVRNAVVAAFGGADGGPRARIGATVYALRFAGAIAALGPWAQIVSITVGTTSTPTAADVTVNIDKMPTLTGANIAVTLV